MGEDGRDDSSHYEVSLTATQAFAAFLLLLGSLGASFAFGIMIGRGRGDDRLVVRREPSIVSEGQARPNANRIVELGVTPTSDDQELPATASSPAILEEPGSSPPTETSDPTGEGSALPANVDASAGSISPTLKSPVTPAPINGGGPPYFAQLISTAEAKVAEGLAARMIEGGFTSAYVERVNSDRGLTYRVRVRFPSQAEARAALPSLRRYTTGEIWITR